MKKNLPHLTALLALALLATGFTFFTNSDTGGLPQRWRPGNIPLRIMLGSEVPLSDGTNHSTSVQAAAESWNPVLGNVQFTTQILPPGPGGDFNGITELTFGETVYGRAFDSNTFAVTVRSIIGNTRRESDVIFNTAWTWESYRGPLRSDRVIDIRRVAIHELGHSLGLDHPDEAGQTVSAIMNTRVSNLDAQTSDDINGAQQLYGPPGVPANDSFANAIALSLTNNATVASGFNTNATKETGEPNHADNSGGRSVWWRWTAPANGSMALYTRGSPFDTTLGVYTGMSVGALTNIASSNDIDNRLARVSSLTFNAINGTTYFIAVDGFNADSAAITLNAAFTPSGGTPPTITTQPASQTVTIGADVTFTVVATGSGRLAYQWLFNGNPIPGATSASYSLAKVKRDSAGDYSVNVTNYSVNVDNEAGTVTSNTATLTVNPDNLAPIFYVQPVSPTVTTGTSVTFTVSVAGYPTPALQWFFGTAAIPGATSATYTITSAQAGNAGSYSVTADNIAGSAVSDTATLTVNAPSPASSGGGGGGAPSAWFLLGVLGLLVARRFLRRRD